MLKLKIIGDAKEVAAQLKTNRPLAVGQIVTCGSEAAMREFAAKHPSLVEIVDAAPVKPEKNKMLKKSPKTKAK